MRHIKPSESSVMREFERIAAEKGWIVAKGQGEYFTERTAPAPLPQSRVPAAPKAMPETTPPWEALPQSRMPAPARQEATPSPQAAKPQAARHRAKYYANRLVGQVQDILNRGGVPVKVDNVWGPNTAKAWNAFLDKAGLSTYDRADPGGARPPVDDMRLLVNYSGQILSDMAAPGRQPKAAPGLMPFEGGKPESELVNPFPEKGSLGKAFPIRWTKGGADMAENIRTAQEPVPEHIPTGLVRKPHEAPAGVEPPTGAEPTTTMRDIDRMLAGVGEPGTYN